MEFLLKVIVCVAGVLALVGNRGDASIDNIVLTKTMLEDNIKSADAKLCHRPCKINVKPKRCHFYLVVQPTSSEDGRTVIAVNETVPGPAIHVCANDIVVAEVTNRIPDQDITIHWHGIEQRGTPYMDGVPMITQCPIGFGSTYKYAFRASTAGTYFYRASSVSHQADGVFGALIVSQPPPLEPHSSLYDYDRSKEHTLVLSATFPELLTANLKDPSSITPNALLINGLQESYKVQVSAGFRYRLRLVNAAAAHCPLVLSVPAHALLVIAADGHAVQPVTAASVLLYPGERMDVVVSASSPGAAHWVVVRGAATCAALRASSPLLYAGYNHSHLALPPDMLFPSSSLGAPESPVAGQALLAAQTAPAPAPGRPPVYLALDTNTVHFAEADNDYRYISDALPKKPFFPSQLSTRGAAVQINGKSLLFPSAPLLTQPRATPPGTTCLVGHEAAHRDPQCLLMLPATFNTPLEMVLVNEGRGSNDSYTFHLHGYSMQVLATESSPRAGPLSVQQVRTWSEQEKIVRNLSNPPLKDTIVVPNKGFTIVRIILDNKGAWLLECSACGIGSLPTGLVLSVPEQMPKSVLDVLPKCGSYRPPDVLLH